MNYAEYAYIKTKELESQYQDIDTNNNNSGTIEVSSGVLNMQVLDQATLPCGEVYLYGESYFQLNTIIDADTVGNIALELLINEVAVITEERTLLVGQNQIILNKSFNPVQKENVTIALRVKILSSGYACTIVNNKLGAWGLVTESNNYNSIKMNLLKHNNQVILSYSENNQIFVTTSNIQEKSFNANDFSVIASGISHCFATSKHNNNVYFFRVDLSGNLFYSEYNSVLNEIKIDQDVSVVFARKCCNAVNEDMLICYIKNGVPMYRCMTNGVIGSATKFNVPNGNYIDIDIVDADDANRTYVVCTHQNLSNYILYSVEETNLTKFVNTLSAKLNVQLRKYLNIINTEENNLVENLSASISVNTLKYLLNFEDLLQNKLIESLKVKVNASTQVYYIEQIPELNYELSFSQIEEYVEGQYRVKYGGDCANWQHATMDLSDTGAIIDNGGILNKWPFSLIKPCLVKDGSIIGYLDPNNYYKFENGADADITNSQYEVMVEFPKIYYKIEQDWDGVGTVANCTKADVKISISNVAKEGYVCYAHTLKGKEYDSIYVSAYENYFQSNVFHCESDYTRSTTTTIYHSDAQSQLPLQKGEQYTTFSYHVSTMLQILSLLLFKDYGGFYVYGTSYFNKSTYLNLPTGTANTRGMFYSLTSIGSNAIKLFGLENILGNSHLIVDGLLSTNNNEYLIYDPTNPDCKLEDYTGANFKKIAFDSYTAYPGYLVRCSADTEYGFLPVTLYVSSGKSKPFYYASASLKWGGDSYSSIPSTKQDTMAFTFGGSYLQSKSSLFSYYSCHNVGNSLNICERLICYPTDKLS